MRHDPVGRAEDHDARPLPALDPVDGRERDAVVVAGPGERGPQPRLEPAGIGMEVGDLQQGLEVVAMGFSGQAGGVEQVDSLTQAQPPATPTETPPPTCSRMLRVLPERARDVSLARSLAKPSTLAATLTSSIRPAARWTSSTDPQRPSQRSIQLGRPRLGRRYTSIRSRGSMRSAPAAIRT